MKLPLFISAKPFVGLTSMRVMLGKGSWRLECSDSSTELDYYVADSQVNDPSILLLENVTLVQAKVRKAGSKPIDVHAISIVS